MVISHGLTKAPEPPNVIWNEKDEVFRFVSV